MRSVPSSFAGEVCESHGSQTRPYLAAACPSSRSAAALPNIFDAEIRLKPSLSLEFSC